MGISLSAEQRTEDQGLCLPHRSLYFTQEVKGPLKTFKQKNDSTGFGGNVKSWSGEA